MFIGTTLFVADLIQMTHSDKYFEYLPDFSTLSYVESPLALAGSVICVIGNHKKLKAILLYNSNINADSEKQKETTF